MRAGVRAPVRGAMRGNHVAARRQRVEQRGDDPLRLVLGQQEVDNGGQDQPDRPGEVQRFLRYRVAEDLIRYGECQDLLVHYWRLVSSH